MENVCHILLPKKYHTDGQDMFGKFEKPQLGVSRYDNRFGKSITLFIHTVNEIYSSLYCRWMCTICLNISSLKLGLYIFMRGPERQWRYFKRYWLNRLVLNHSKPQRCANSMDVPSHVLYKNTTTSILGRTVQNDTEFSVITFKTSRWQRQRQTRLDVFILVGVMCINSGRMTPASTVSRRRCICDVISFVVLYHFPRKHLPTKMKCSHMIIITYTIKAHYNDVIMGWIAPQITNLTIVYSGTNQRNHQSSAPLAFVWEFTYDRWIPRTWDQ